MSSSRIGQEVQDKYNKIQDGLLRIRPRLNEVSLEAPDSIIEELNNIASLAESLSSGWSRFGKTASDRDESWKTISDGLDREGVNLWNASGLLRHSKSTPEETNLKVLAAARLAAFRLIEAGLESNPPADTLVHTLQIASKTAVAIAHCGKEELALSILTCAAQMEQDLRNLPPLDAGMMETSTTAIICYYSSRMEVALIARMDEDQAFYMLEQITDADESRLASVKPHDLEILAAKVLDMGKLILREPMKFRNGNVQTEVAVKWLQKALSLAEKLPIEAKTTSRSLHLKQSIMRSLARAYYLSSEANPEYLSRAEVTLNELLGCDASHDEMQQFRWMYIAVLRKKGGADQILLEAFLPIVDHLEFSESRVNDVLRELKSITQDLATLSSVLLKILRRALSEEGRTGRPFVEKILMSLLFVCSRETDNELAIGEVAAACDAVAERESYELPKIPCAACQSLIWQFGEKQYASGQWTLAAKWYLLGTHKTFRSMAPTRSSKYLRKVAMCYLEAKDFANALEIARTCPETEASTHYIRFLATSYQGLEDKASKAINDMIRAPDFDRQMLLLAVQVAHESKQKSLLLTILHSLYDTICQSSGNILPGTEETILHTSTILRCSIRLILEMIDETADNMAGVVSLLVTQTKTTLAFVDDVCTNGSGSVIAKDISWFWRTVYNVAVRGCSEWDACENEISSLFEVVEKLINIYAAKVVGGPDSELAEHRTYTAFCSIAGKVFAARASKDANEKEALQRSILNATSSFKIHAVDLVNNNDQNETRTLLHLVFVFELETMTDLSLWNEIETVIEGMPSKETLTVETYEAVVDVLWGVKDCPANVLQRAIELVLRSILENDTFSIPLFSRWLRVICIILLARNSPVDQQKVMAYIEDAIEVMRVEGGPDGAPERTDDLSEQGYPLDERYWLLSTAYNNGVECLSSRDSDRAKSWFELSVVLCRHVPDGDSRSAKINRAYEELLSRY